VSSENERPKPALIARGDHRPSRAVPEHKGEVAQKPANTIFAPLLKRQRNQLDICQRSLSSLTVQGREQFFAVVETPIKGNLQTPTGDTEGQPFAFSFWRRR
jgi:hypothetical protein